MFYCTESWKKHNTFHENIFKSRICEFAPRPRSLAAVYILTADNELWKYMKERCKDGKIEFDGISLFKLTPEQYALFAAAKDLYLDETHLALTDLADNKTLPDKTFMLITKAISIARKGRKIKYETEDIY